jgi:hypothetical protein
MEATAAATPSGATAAAASQPATASCLPCTAPAQLQPVLRSRPGSRFMACACGKDRGGLCKGQSVKSGGLRLPWGLLGSSEYTFRERTLIKLMGRQRFSEQKERLIALVLGEILQGCVDGLAREQPLLRALLVRTALAWQPAAVQHEQRVDAVRQIHPGAVHDRLHDWAVVGWGAGHERVEVCHRLLVQPAEEVHADALRAALLPELYRLADASEQHQQPRGPHQRRVVVAAAGAAWWLSLLLRSRVAAPSSQQGPQQRCTVYSCTAVRLYGSTAVRYSTHTARQTDISDSMGPL